MKGVIMKKLVWGLLSLIPTLFPFLPVKSHVVKQLEKTALLTQFSGNKKHTQSYTLNYYRKKNKNELARTNTVKKKRNIL